MTETRGATSSSTFYEVIGNFSAHVTADQVISRYRNAPTTTKERYQRLRGVMADIQTIADWPFLSGMTPWVRREPSDADIEMMIDLGEFVIDFLSEVGIERVTEAEPETTLIERREALMTFEELLHEALWDYAVLQRAFENDGEFIGYVNRADQQNIMLRGQTIVYCESPLYRDRQDETYWEIINYRPTWAPKRDDDQHELTILYAREADIPGCIEVWRATGFGDGVSESEAAEGWQHAIADPHEEVLIARRDGKAVGIASARFGTERADGRAILRFVGAVPSERGNGVGLRLRRTMTRMMRDAGHSGFLAEAHTQDGYEAAMRDNSAIVRPGDALPQTGNVTVDLRLRYGPLDI